MARATTFRLRIKGTLVARTPLHVGGLGGEAGVDLALARDGRDRFCVPGTSLAGALRAWCAAEFHEPDVIHVWGYQDKEDSTKGEASRVVVTDMVLDDGAAIEERRDGVGIDRDHGAAARGVKYDRAILPRGTKLPFELIAEDDVEGRDRMVSMLQALAEALIAGEIRLGAAKTRGLGRVALEQASIREQPGLNTAKGMLARLRGADTAPEPLQTPPLRKPRSPRIVLTVRWQPVGPLMVKDGADGLGVDMLPLVSRGPDGLAPVLPGSSVKGAFRSRAEQIVRTLADWPHADEFQDAIEVPLVQELFGSRGTAKDQAFPDDRLGLGALSIDDCYGQQPIPENQWRAVIAADAEQVNDALKAANLAPWSAAFHVAVDRWTGGAADSALFTVLEPHAVVWEPLTLTVDTARFQTEDECTGAIALLLLVLRDLGRGRLPLGFATHRGMGAVEVEAVEVKWNGWRDGALKDITLPRGDSAPLKDAFDVNWRKAIEDVKRRAAEAHP